MAVAERVENKDLVFTPWLDKDYEVNVNFDQILIKAKDAPLEKEWYQELSGKKGEIFAHQIVRFKGLNGIFYFYLECDGEDHTEYQIYRVAEDLKLTPRQIIKTNHKRLIWSGVQVGDSDDDSIETIHRKASNH